MNGKALTKKEIPKELVEFFIEKGLKAEKLEILFSTFLKEYKGSNWMDFVWHTFQNLHFEYVNNVSDLLSLYKYQSDIYSKMIYFRRKYEKIADNYLHELFLISKVEELDCSKLMLNFSLLGDHRCSYSSKNKAKYYSKSDILNKIKEIHNNCDNPKWCTCSIVSESIRNNDGILVLKNNVDNV